jgi:hypothetical protein
VTHPGAPQPVSEPRAQCGHWRPQSPALLLHPRPSPSLGVLRSHCPALAMQSEHPELEPLFNHVTASQGSTSLSLSFLVFEMEVIGAPLRGRVVMRKVRADLMPAEAVLRIEAHQTWLGPLHTAGGTSYPPGPPPAVNPD